jgi:putative peptidoglycan lipid II flippase
MKDAFRSAFLVTVFTFSAQLVLFIVQIISAALFGASAEMDAFLAANTIPQYIITVLLGSLGFVFIPFYVDFKSRGMEEKAHNLAVILFNNCIFFLGIITIIGIVFTRPLLHAIAPGLSAQTLDLASNVAIITWPSILASGALSLLSSIYQAEKRFRWQSAVPFIGAIFTLILILALAPAFGVIGFALATTLGGVIQVLLLIKIIRRNGNYQFKLGWGNADFHRVMQLVFPLIFVGLITKLTPVIDRYLASGLPEGSISHLNYAFKIISTFSLLISIGGATVIFPKMALDVSGKGMRGLRNTISLGLRTMWLIVAPVVTISISLSLPFIITVFKYGEFKMSDAITVAMLMQVYVFALIAMCLSSITNKGFYVLRDSKTLAIMGPIEVLAYACYTILLTKWLGIMGIAIGYVIYFTLSLVWQLIVLNIRTGYQNGSTITKSFSKTILAATAGGILTYGVTLVAPGNIIQIIVGGGLGLLIYVGVLFLVRSAELKMITEILFKKSTIKS